MIKIADALYCGGNTSYELLVNWKKVLQALYQCDIRLSSSKTVVNPTSTTILGWIWRSNCSRFIVLLDDIVAGRQSNEAISWSDDLRAVFKEAQLALSSNRTITLPKPDDLLWIVTDGAVRPPGIGATLYVTRGNKLHLASFYSAKLRRYVQKCTQQQKWQKREHVGKSGKYGENDNFTTIGATGQSTKQSTKQ